MDLTDAFRTLVTNQYMPDFDYRGRFQFETVFYKTGYSYACCPCAFQHEFLTYISDDGSIDEKVYEDIVSYIVFGRCTHVGRGVPDAWVKETSVSGLQIAVAVSTKQAEQDKMERSKITRRKEEIFQLSLHNIVLIKKKYDNLEWYLRTYFTKTDLFDFIMDNDYVLVCRKSNENQDVFIVEKLTLIETLVHTRDNGVIKDVLESKTRYGDSDTIFMVV